MLQIARQLCLGLCLSASAIGCLSTLPSTASIKPETPLGNGSIGKDQKLPDKDTAEIQLSIAEELDKNGYWADAADRFEKARQLDAKHKHVARRLALLYDKSGNERQALEEYEKALELTPNDADLISDLGYCHYNRGRWTDAETCFRRALGINAKHKKANVNLGLALAQQGKQTEALEAFGKVTRPAEAKANVAFVLAAQGKKAEAKIMYQEALKQEPGLYVAQNGLASLETPKKPEMIDAPVKACRADGSTCAGGVCSKPPVPIPDMSPITIDPFASRKAKSEASED